LKLFEHVLVELKLEFKGEWQFVFELLLIFSTFKERGAKSFWLLETQQEVDFIEM